MSNYAIIYSDSLSHHGIQGQKWGQRNGPPYPLDSEDHSAREKKAGWRKSLDKSSNSNKSKRKKTNNSSKKVSRNKSNKSDSIGRKLSAENSKVSTKSISEILKVSDEDAEKLKKFAVVAGISLATAAGLYAAGYYLKNHPEVVEAASKKFNGIMNAAKKGSLTSTAAEFGVLQPGYNLNGSLRTYNIGSNQLKFNAGQDAVGEMARHYGFEEIKPENLFSAGTGYLDHADPDEMIHSMRLDFATNASSRRLSCWSGSNAYYLSRMTGNDYCSKSYENLVNFNDFGSLYKEKPNIFNISGEQVSDFVGKYGTAGQRAGTSDYSEKLIRSIVSNTQMNEKGPTIGFVNAAYHSTTCTHEWNYEIEQRANGLKRVFMADSYTGQRYSVADIASDGSYTERQGMASFIMELRHYNAESIRFYKPELESINAETMSKVVLGLKPGSTMDSIRNFRHAIEEGKYMGNYYAIDYSSDSLEHHGIKGQRWGVRRFQNDDGSLTSAGRSRYDVGEARRAAVEGGLIGYANYRRTHQAPTAADRANYKKAKAKDKERRRKARINKATQRDYELSKKMGLVKNRKEYDEAMKYEKKDTSKTKTTDKSKTKNKMNVAEKALNVASMGVYGNIRKAEKAYKENGPTMNNAFGLALKGGVRYWSSQGNRFTVNIIKAVGATAASAVYQMHPTPAVKTGAMIVGKTVNAMGNLAIGMTDAYNIYAQGRDTVDYIKKKRNE